MELPTLYQKTASGSINYWRVWTDNDEVCTEWGQVGTDSPQRQSFVAKPTNVGRRNERDGVAQAEFEAKALWKKKKRVKYFESVEAAETELNLKPMLAQNYEDRLAKGKVAFPVTVQPKLNGYRCFVFKRAGEVHVMSRGAKSYGMQHIIDDVRPFLVGGDLEVILDGELYHHGMSLQRLGSLVKKPRYPESAQVQMHVYDATSTKSGYEEMPWAQRFDMLINLYRGLISKLTYFRTVECLPAESDHQVRKLHDAYVADGYEGVIVRTQDHTYRFGYRSPGLLKYKTFEDKEFIIVSWTVGKDNVPLWICKQEEGKEFEVRPTGTAEERAEMLADADQQIGKLLKVRFQERTEKNIPHIARGIEIRDEADL